MDFILCHYTDCKKVCQVNELCLCHYTLPNAIMWALPYESACKYHMFIKPFGERRFSITLLAFGGRRKAHQRSPNYSAALSALLVFSSASLMCQGCFLMGAGHSTSRCRLQQVRKINHILAAPFSPPHSPWTGKCAWCWKQSERVHNQTSSWQGNHLVRDDAGAMARPGKSSF